MADRAITALPAILGSAVDATDVFTLVHVPETDPTLKNKKILVTELGSALATLAGIGPVKADNVLAVSVTNGSDSTGTVGRLDKPYKTLSAAQTAASSGKMIHAYPGSYAAQELLKNGVNWHFDPGTTLTATASGTNAGTNVFDDAGVAITSVISGDASIVCTGTGGYDTPEQACVTITGASDVRLKVNSLSQQVSPAGGGTAYAIFQSAGRLWLTADLIETTQPAQYGIWWANGDCHVNARLISGVQTNNVPVFANVSATPTGDLYVNADEILSLDNSAIQSSSGQAEAKAWIRAAFISSADNAILSSGGKLYILECAKIVGTSDSGTASNVGVVQSSAGALWCKSEKITGTYASAINVSGGTAEIFVLQIEDLGHLTQAVLVTGGTLYLHNAVINTTLGDGIVCSAGTVHLINCTITTPGGKHDLVQSSTGTIIVHPSTTGTNSDGTLTTSGTITYLRGGRPRFYHGT